MLLLQQQQQPENFFYTREFEIERAKVTRRTTGELVPLSMEKSFLLFSLLFLITFFSFYFIARDVNLFWDSRQTRFNSRILVVIKQNFSVHYIFN